MGTPSRALEPERSVQMSPARQVKFTNRMFLSPQSFDPAMPDLARLLHIHPPSPLGTGADHPYNQLSKKTNFRSRLKLRHSVLPKTIAKCLRNRSTIRLHPKQLKYNRKRSKKGRGP
jgi:hypothetical protein